LRTAQHKAQRTDTSNLVDSALADAVLEQILKTFHVAFAEAAGADKSVAWLVDVEASWALAVELAASGHISTVRAVVVEPVVDTGAKRLEVLSHQVAVLLRLEPHVGHVLRVKHVSVEQGLRQLFVQSY